MKKLLSVIAVGVLIFTSCSNPSNTQDSASHTEHTYGDWETVKAPTCTEKGQKKHKCTGCDKEETAEIDAKGHSFAAEWETDKDNHWHKATCGHDTEKSALGAHVDSDSDGKCDACSFDMTADWPAPKFVFSDEGYAFKPLRETVKYRKNSGEEGFKLDGAIIAVPTVDSEGNVTFCNMSDRISEDPGLRIGNIDTKNPYIIFKDGQICSGDDECYILYDDLKSACDKAKVKMDKDLFFDLNFQLNNYSYAD